MCYGAPFPFQTIDEREYVIVPPDDRSRLQQAGQRRMRPTRGVASMKLFVGSLSFDTREDDLRQAFAAYGTPTSVAVITDRDTGRSKGFGFVEFANDDEAKKAMEALNGKELQGRTITVAEARPREDRGGRGGGGGGRRDRY
jgi:cold-inducible RNA-binding protein